MLKQAKVVDFEKESPAGTGKEKKIKLLMGRKMTICQDEAGEVIRLLSPDEEVIMQIVMTQAGPVVSVNCGTLELNASDNITLAAKNVAIEAENETVIKSKGALKIESDQKMDIKSEDDIVLNGKMIHIN